jgi:hypothetical protein
VQNLEKEQVQKSGKANESRAPKMMSEVFLGE